MNTDDLIANLITEPQKNILRTPYYYSVCVIFIIVLYALFMQYILGVRADIVTQFMRPEFVIECGLLMILSIFSIIAAVLSMYPDMCNKKIFLKIPYIIFLVLIAYLIYQMIFTHNPMMIIPNPDAIKHTIHPIECSICIAAVSVIPSGLMLLLQSKGASVYPVHSGSFAVLSASAVGAVVLRFAEMEDCVTHLMLWHYVPTFIFACIGAALGRWVLRW